MVSFKQRMKKIQCNSDTQLEVNMYSLQSQMGLQVVKVLVQNASLISWEKI